MHRFIFAKVDMQAAVSARRHRSLDKRESDSPYRRVIGAGLAKVSQAVRHREYQMR
jgi:hypothetical protein